MDKVVALARAGVVVPAALVIALAGVAIGHDEDLLKARNRGPRVEGPVVTGPVSSAAPDNAFDADGIEMLAWIPLNQFPGTHNAGNDCWGYVSPSGREYALMGLQCGTGVVEITNPTSPVILGVINGPCSSWRDIKVVGEYAYTVSEGGAGIQVIDLSNIDNGVVTHVQDKKGGGHNSTHNIAANPDSGYLYLCGGNISNGGLVAVSTANPADPTIAGAWSDFYVHDAQIVTYDSGPAVGLEIAYCAAGLNGGWSNGGLRVVNVTNKSNMVTIADEFWPSVGYSHQCWLTEDRKFLLLGDELDNYPGVGTPGPMRTIVFDVQDPFNPLFKGTFGNGLNNIDHNQYVRNGKSFQADYTTGLRVFDVSDPLAAFQVAWFDTHPETDAAEFEGAWSVYPFFESGSILISDINRGLFVVRFECRPDLNQDGLLDFFDFLAFQNLFNAGDPIADFDGNGVLDFFDFLAFQNEFAAGCQS